MLLAEWLIEELSPKKVSEEELKKALEQHVLKNKDSRLTKIIPTVLSSLEKGKFKALLSPKGHDYVYRFIDVKDKEQLASILKKPTSGIRTKEYTVLGKGVLAPKDELSSWTVNPRSLVYSGFFSVVAPRRNLVLFKAKILQPNNSFFGNPDSMASELETDPGYWLEREVIGCGPIHYEKAVYGFLDKGQSLEGLAMDLVNLLWKLKDVDFDDDNYYFPSELRM